MCPHVCLFVCFLCAGALATRTTRFRNYFRPTAARTRLLVRVQQHRRAERLVPVAQLSGELSEVSHISLLHGCIYATYFVSSCPRSFQCWRTISITTRPSMSQTHPNTHTKPQPIQRANPTDPAPVLHHTHNYRDSIQLCNSILH